MKTAIPRADLDQARRCSFGAGCVQQAREHHVAVGQIGRQDDVREDQRNQEVGPDILQPFPEYEAEEEPERDGQKTLDQEPLGKGPEIEALGLHRGHRRSVRGRAHPRRSFSKNIAPGIGLGR
jgi:hypothetical protein